MKETECAASGESGVAPPGALTTASTVKFTLHTSGNVIYHFREEYQKVIKIDSYT
jgi:hypothetical protein